MMPLHVEAALALFRDMSGRRIEQDSRTYVAAMSSSAKGSQWDLALNLLCRTHVEPWKLLDVALFFESWASQLPPTQNLGPEVWFSRSHRCQKFSLGEKWRMVVSICPKMLFLAIFEFRQTFALFLRVLQRERVSVGSGVKSSLQDSC